MATEQASRPRSDPASATPQHHHPALAPAGLLLSMAGPAMLGIAGLVVLGPDAVDWLTAIVWGLIATVAFTLVSMAGKAMGMTQMDLLDLLGSAMVQPGSGASRATGMMIHLVNGALLAIFGVYAIGLVGAEVNWLTGAIWGAVVTAFALLMMTTIGAVHPAIRRGDQVDPGPAATHFGSMTPMGSLLGHLAYGIVLGAGYANLPLT